MTNPFLDHPNRAGETYCQHLRFATAVGLTMLTGGLCCLIHGIAPWLLQTAGSQKVFAAHRMIAVRRAAEAC